MSNQHKPIFAMLAQIRTQTIEKLYKGQLDYDQAMLLLKKQLQVAKKTGNKKLVGEFYIALQIIELELGSLYTGIAYSYKALATFALINDAEGLSSTHNNLGEICRRLGKTAEAIDHYTQARVIAQAAARTQDEVVTYLNEGTVYLHLGDVDRALGMFNQVFSILATLEKWGVGVRRYLFEARSNAAKAYALQGEFATAWQHVNVALEGAQQSGELAEVARAYHVMAFISIMEEAPAATIAAYFKASADAWYQCKVMDELGRLRVLEGDYWASQHQLDHAQTAYQAAIGLFRERNLPDELNQVQARLDAISTSSAS